MKAATLGVFMTSPIIDVVLRKRPAKELHKPVYQKLVKGSKPPIPGIYIKGENINVFQGQMLQKK